jgi:ribosomal protein L16 Arg81 hydroxylase
VDPETVSAEAPEEPPVAYQEVDLDPGDMLFIPVGWWHHVRAHTTSISLAFNCFPRENNFDWFRPTAPPKGSA